MQVASRCLPSVTSCHRVVKGMGQGAGGGGVGDGGRGDQSSIPVLLKPKLPARGCRCFTFMPAGPENINLDCLSFRAVGGTGRATVLGGPQKRLALCYSV